MSGDSLIFRAGTLLCALRLDDIVETMRPLPVQPLAGTPPFVLGVCVLRGMAVPVVDIARLLGGGESVIARFIAAKSEHNLVALAAGPVIGVRDTGADQRQAPAPMLGAAAARLVSAVGVIETEPLLCLRSTQLVPDEVWAALAAEGSTT